MKRPFVVWHNYHCDHGSCSYAVIEDRLTVRTCHGSKTVRFDGECPEAIARTLIWEIESDLDGLQT
jgi:hypothetical protein